MRHHLVSRRRSTSWRGTASPYIAFDATGTRDVVSPLRGRFAARCPIASFSEPYLPAAHQRLGWQALHASAVADLTRRGHVLRPVRARQVHAGVCVPDRSGLTQWADDSVVVRPNVDRGDRRWRCRLTSRCGPRPRSFFHPERGEDVQLLGRVEQASPPPRQWRPSASSSDLMARLPATWPASSPRLAFDDSFRTPAPSRWRNPSNGAERSSSISTSPHACPVWDVTIPRGSAPSGRRRRDGASATSRHTAQGRVMLSRALVRGRGGASQSIRSVGEAARSGARCWWVRGTSGGANGTSHWRVWCGDLSGQASGLPASSRQNR